MSKNIKPSTGFIDRSRAQQLVEKWKPLLEHSSDKVAPITLHTPPITFGKFVI